MKKLNLIELIEQGIAEFVYSDGIAMIRKERDEEVGCDILDALCDCINLND